jgi:RNA polymerase sigma-70 factor (ECF subfamily)
MGMMQTEDETLRGTNDVDMVVRARTDRIALGQLYDIYYRRIFRHCLRRLFNRSVAEDVTSDVFLRVAGRIAQFAGSTHDDFVRWVHAIATNEINAYLRQSGRRSRLLEEAARRKAIHVVDQSATSVSLAALDWPRVYEALLALNPRDQSIVTLRFFEDLSHEQIAGILDMRCGAVRTALTRALEKFRRELGVKS